MVGLMVGDMVGVLSDSAPDSAPRLRRGRVDPAVVRDRLAHLPPLEPTQRGRTLRILRRGRTASWRAKRKTPESRNVAKRAAVP